MPHVVSFVSRHKRYLLVYFKNFLKLCASVRIFLNFRKIFRNLFLNKEFKQEEKRLSLQLLKVLQRKQEKFIKFVTCNKFWEPEKSFKKTFPYRFEFIILLYQWSLNFLVNNGCMSLKRLYTFLLTQKKLPLLPLLRLLTTLKVWVL